jgi:hypothetical protein
MRIPVMAQTGFGPGKLMFQGQSSLMIPEGVKREIGSASFFDSPDHRAIVEIEPGIESPKDTWDVTVTFQDEQGRQQLGGLSATYNVETGEPVG